MQRRSHTTNHPPGQAQIYDRPVIEEISTVEGIMPQQSPSMQTRSADLSAQILQGISGLAGHTKARTTRKERASPSTRYEDITVDAYFQEAFSPRHSESVQDRLADLATQILYGMTGSDRYSEDISSAQDQVSPTFTYQDAPVDEAPQRHVNDALHSDSGGIFDHLPEPSNGDVNHKHLLARKTDFQRRRQVRLPSVYPINNLFDTFRPSKSKISIICINLENTQRLRMMVPGVLLSQLPRDANL